MVPEVLYRIDHLAGLPSNGPADPADTSNPQKIAPS